VGHGDRVAQPPWPTAVGKQPPIRAENYHGNVIKIWKKKKEWVGKEKRVRGGAAKLCRVFASLQVFCRFEPL
jgi:hypothetical protein